MNRMKLFKVAILVLIAFSTQAQEISIGNSIVERKFVFDGKVWKTTLLKNKTAKKDIPVKSDEFLILPMDKDSGLTIADFTIAQAPEKYTRADSSFLTFRYKPLPATANNPVAPKLLTIKFAIKKNENFIRKYILLEYDKPATVDRLEVERLTINLKQSGGGRGEPVFVGDELFLGLEYPGGYTRHTDGNTPVDYGRHYEKVGNYSFINLEGRDIEPKAKKDLIRLMHFPGYAVQKTTLQYQIAGKPAVIGFTRNNQSAEMAFMTYLEQIWKKPKSFLHYNNWFEPKAKDLSGDGLINIFREFKVATAPYGINLDAVVPDNGWQNTKSIWDPLPKYFPNGISDVKKLSDRLKAEGTGFGLWLSLNGYVNKIDWGIAEGYKEAKANSYFKQFGRYYSLSSTQYKDTVLHKIPKLAQETGTIYFKHDFNQLSDMAEGNNHPATDRHGHEANLDACLAVLMATRKLNPEIYQNLTNWIWFSPYWLKYADALWMLAGDDGTNGNWPEISTRAMASTDRDTYLWRMWGNPEDRPLVPISRLMTHGIIKTSDGRMESPADNLQDWQEYVLMHYGRGTLLKEWYISPSAMQPEQWKALCTVHNWAKAHQKELNHTVFVGGRPDEGNAYGYIGWNGDKGVLVARNPNAKSQKLKIPFNKSIFFTGQIGQFFHANVVFPYVDQYPENFIAGKDIEITLPGYATMAFEFEKGKVGASIPLPAPPVWTKNESAEGLFNELNVPADAEKRCDLLVIGYPDVPEVSVDGKPLTPTRKSKAQINNFASYAVSGMPSTQAKPWNMVSLDLKSYAGKKIKLMYKNGAAFQSFLLMEQDVRAAKMSEGKDQLWPITNNTRRQTIQLIDKTH